MEYSAYDEREPNTVEKARRGDSEAFVELVQHYQTPVFNLAYRMLGNAADAEDAAQETFLRAYTQLAGFVPGRKFASWLLGIAAHYCIDRLRRAKFSGPSLDDEDWRDRLAADAPLPDDVVLAHEQQQDAQRLLNGLPPAYRAVVVLKYWSDLSMEEIARATGDTPGAVKVKLYRARQAMARAAAKQSVTHMVAAGA
jgi:RNA polymerase sigma-70 factor, ECF subfamily